MIHYLSFLILGLFFYSSCSGMNAQYKDSFRKEGRQKEIAFFNPNKDIKVEINTGDEGRLYYKIFFRSEQLLEPSELGIVMEDADFSTKLEILKISSKEEVRDYYTLLHGKQKQIYYEANRYIVNLENKEGKRMDLIFQLSDDGVAFRYHFPEKSTSTKKITEEKTTYNFVEGTRGWLQPMSKAKTGWSRTNPSYEENYMENITLDTKPVPGEGWVYPALFKVNDAWILITEAALDRTYSATRLINTSNNGMKVAFPQNEEVLPGGGLIPESTLPWFTPWRILAIGDLETITESTLGTDLANPTKIEETDFIETGLASWSWALLKDESINYETTKNYIDYAAQMDWKYCLIDVNWDTRIGDEKIKELVDYANARGVEILVWYNSSGSWNDTPYTPKGKLLTRADREREFKKLRELGVAGIKVDFFGGDGRSVIDYYHDIMEDAGKFKLVLNFHGATLPRGWHRTYPHLLTVEAIKGHEFITFEQGNADLAPSHAAILPFSRNAFDPMDFTPMVLDTIPGINRRTTPGFELALPVLFLSGIQHIAETPKGMAKQPEFVREYLRDIPVQWDESKFISGFPGKEVVMARRKGKTWHIVGINGENREKSFEFELDFLKDSTDGYLITHSGDGFSKEKISKTEDEKMAVKVEPYGGFVIKMN